MRAFLLALALLSATAAEAGERAVVYTVNYPLAFLAEQIGAERVDVRFPVPPEVDPAFWQPGPGAVLAMQSADLVLLNGAGYARWLGSVTLRRSRLVDTSAAFGDRLLPLAGTATHSHGPTGAHSHAGTASTTWLDLRQAVQQAEAVTDAVSRLLPGEAGAFRRRYDDLESELLALDARFRAIMATEAARQPLLASHPVYGYFARRYELDLRAVTWEPRVLPAEREWQALEALLRERPSAWMLWEAEPLPAIAKRLRSLGVRSVVVSTVANRPSQGNLLTALERNVQNLSRAFSGETLE